MIFDFAMPQGAVGRSGAVLRGGGFSSALGGRLVWNGGMFTGLIEETGIVEGLERSVGASRLTVRAPGMAADARVGESIAVNGCCLTVAAAPAGGVLEFDLLEETLRRTNLGGITPGTAVNLERALLASGRLGGHFVQGHIDCTAHIKSWEALGDDHRLEVELPGNYAKYVVEKGSIAIDGISLTVAGLTENSFTVWIIPHTRSVTNLVAAHAGGLVNLEFDLLAKYVERIIAHE
jgi:riboflavin synthase